jgi:GxxExxY protein
MPENKVTHSIIGAAMEVHRLLGPGLLESAYEECLCHELHVRGIAFERQKPIPVLYKSVKLESGYRLDLLVGGEVIVELKAIDALGPHSRGDHAYLSSLVWTSCRADYQFQRANTEGGIRRYIV